MPLDQSKGEESWREEEEREGGEREKEKGRERDWDSSDIGGTGVAHLRNKMQFANPASIIGPTWRNNSYIPEIPEHGALAEHT